MTLSNFGSVVVAGFGIVVFSFPVTFVLAIVCLIIWRVFDGEIGRVAACVSGVAAGSATGILLDIILDSGNHSFFAIAGVIGASTGYVEYAILRCMVPKK